MGGSIKNGLLTVFSLCFILMATEFALRLYLRDDYSVPSHRNWLFKNYWYERYEQLNSLGYRDHEFTWEKPDNTYRILVVGDSFTYGQGIKDINGLYTELLEYKLNNDSLGVKYEVLNTGKQGWDVKQYRDFIKNTGLKFDPDLVIIGFYLNDIEKDKAIRPQSIKIPKTIHFVLSRASYLYWYTYYRLDQLINSKRYEDYVEQYTSTKSYHWKHFVSLWEELLNECRRNNIKTIVAILPQLYILSDNHPFLNVYNNVKKLSEQHDAMVPPIFSYIKGYDEKELWIGITDSHPNENAHRIIANALYDFIKEKRLVPRFD